MQRKKETKPKLKPTAKEIEALAEYATRVTTASRHFAKLVDEAEDLETALVAHVALAGQLGAAWDLAICHVDTD